MATVIVPAGRRPALGYARSRSSYLLHRGLLRLIRASGSRDRAVRNITDVVVEYGAVIG